MLHRSTRFKKGYKRRFIGSTLGIVVVRLFLYIHFAVKMWEAAQQVGYNNLSTLSKL